MFMVEYYLTQLDHILFNCVSFENRNGSYSPEAFILKQRRKLQRQSFYITWRHLVPSEVFPGLPDWLRGAPDLLIYSLDPPSRLGQTRIQTGSENSTDQRWVSDWRRGGGGDGGHAGSGRTAVRPPGSARLGLWVCVVCCVWFSLVFFCAVLQQKWRTEEVFAQTRRTMTRQSEDRFYYCVCVVDVTAGGSAQCIGSVSLHHRRSIHFQSTNSHDPSVDYMSR